MTDLNAGPLADRMIAETVMRWKIAQWVLYPAITRNIVYTTEPEKVQEYARGGARVGLLIEDTGDVEHFSPTERIACAWRVVEHLRSRGFAVDVSTAPLGRWLCRFDDLSAKAERLMAPQSEQRTAPLAISAAALEAIQR